VSAVRRTSAALAAIGSGNFSNSQKSRLLDLDALAGLRSRATEVLTGYEIAPDAIERAAEELHGLARDAEALASRMLQAGRRLLRLQRELGHGACRALIRAGLIPFGDAMASRLRTVAEAVEVGRVPEPSLPRALSTAYAVARLPAPDAARLVQDGTVRPDVTAREIREALRAPSSEMLDDGPLTPGRRRLLERRAARLREELARIEARLGRP
jgi:hypothetical protein